jgi:hypothetical protein
VIIAEEQRRAMEFIAAANMGGYRPTGNEINQWRLNPEPMPARKGEMLDPGTPPVPERRVRRRAPSSWSVLADFMAPHAYALNTLSRQLASISPTLMTEASAAAMASVSNRLHALDWLGADEYETIPGKPGKPAEYEPDKPPERFLAHLRRLGWIERDPRGRYGVTLLGQALMRADDTYESDSRDASVIVLAAADQNLGYSQVLGCIADSGHALVVDGYLGTQELMHILAHTDATRFLIGDKLSRDRVAELAVLIGLAQPNSAGIPRQLRKASFHDRYVLGEHRVYTLTASLNGVGKSLAVLIEMTDVAGLAIRTHVEELWTNGEVIADGLTTYAQRETTSNEPSPAVPARKIHPDGARFLHEGCEVRHRTARAAENCTNGT